MINADLAILTVGKWNAFVIFNISEYNRNIGNFLEEAGWKRLAMDTIQTVECRTTLKKSALAAEVSVCLLNNHQTAPHIIS